MKKFFLTYAEDRTDLVISSSARVVLRTSFRKGTFISYHGGFRTKSDALDWAEQVNNTAGSVIASLYGSVDVKRGEAYRITSDEEKAA